MSWFKRKADKQTEIVPNQDFLHGTERLKKGQKYLVDADLARYFANNGWLEGEHSAPPPVVSLEVQDIEHGHEGGF